MDINALIKKYSEILSPVSKGLSQVGNAVGQAAQQAFNANPTVQNVRTIQQVAPKIAQSFSTNWNKPVQKFGAPNTMLPSFGTVPNNPLSDFAGNVASGKVGPTFKIPEISVPKMGLNPLPTGVLKTPAFDFNPVQIAGKFLGGFQTPEEQANHQRYAKIQMTPREKLSKEDIAFAQKYSNENYVNQGMAFAGTMGGPKASGWASAKGKFTSLLDKKDKFQIPDNQAYLRVNTVKKAVDEGVAKLSDILSHNKLFEQYPQFKNLRVVFDKNIPEGTQGSFNPETFSISVNPKAGSLRSTLLHETQHAIQTVENFARGGNESQFVNTSRIKELNSELKNVEKELKKPNADVEGLEDLRQQIEFELASEESNPFNSYQNLAGEIEARAVEERQGLNAKQLMSSDPYAATMAKDYISRGDVITRFGDGTSASIKKKPTVGPVMTPEEQAIYDKGVKLFGEPGVSEPHQPLTMQDLQKASDAQKPNVPVLTSEEAKNAAGTATYKAETNVQNWKNTISRWLGNNKNADLEGYQFGKQLEKLDSKQADAFIKGVESGNVPPELKSFAEKFRQLDDYVFNLAKQNGIDLNYLRNHISHIWNESPVEVQQKYAAFKQKYNFANQRQIPTYEEGIKMGLTPKFTDPRQIIGYQVKQLHKTINGLEAFKSLKDSGQIVPASVGVKTPGFKPVDALGFPRNDTMVGDTKVVGSWYAPKEIVDEINKVFGEKSVNTILKIGAKTSGVVQDVTMSGGVPFTPINAWTLAQISKEFLAGRVKSPIRALFAGEKYFDEKIPVIKRMQQNDLSVNIGRGVEDLSAPKGFGKIGEWWNKAVNNPTFKKFSPSLQISMFEDVSNALQKKGKSVQEADAIAAKAVKNFYGSGGIYKDATSNPNVNAGVKTFFFAPKYRESIINFWANSIKGLKNPFAPENVNNTKFLAGAAISLFAMDQANRYFNDGRSMTENPSGMEDKLMIPLSKITGDQNDQTVVAVPWLSSIATLPRLGARTVFNVAKGNISGAALDIGRTTLSQPFKPAFDIAVNEQYSGKQIVPDNATPSEKWGTIAKYYGSQFNHPYLKELFDSKNSSDPGYQRLARAMELPIRFYTQKQIDTKYYFDSKNKSEESLSTQEKSALAAIPKYDAQSNDPNSTILKYQTYLTYPKVFEAKQKTELETAQKTGKAIDPLYLVDYNTAKQYMRYETLPPGSQDRKDMVKASPELQALFEIRSKYFDENPISLASNKTTGIPRPVASAYAQQQMNAKNWKDPEVQAYLNATTAYNNQQREKLGLPPIAGYTPFAKKPKKLKVTAKMTKIPKIKVKKISYKMPKVKKIKQYKLKTVKRLT